MWYDTDIRIYDSDLNTWPAAVTVNDTSTARFGRRHVISVLRLGLQHRKPERHAGGHDDRLSLQPSW